MAKQKIGRRQLVVDPAYTIAKQYGDHPKYHKSFIRAMIDCRHLSVKEWIAKYHRPLIELKDPRHPLVYVLPRDHFCLYTDDFDEAIGPEQVHLWFSSTDFSVDYEEGQLFSELDHPLFNRLGGLPQLQFLVPPYVNKDNKDELIFTTAPFSHPRWIHCLISAVLAEVILARAGFSTMERAPLVLASAYHDAALPAGGDSVKRIDPEELDEEKNFPLVIERAGLAEKWKNQYGFRLDEAAAWVNNEGLFGLLLDILDKMSYVCLDCYHLGHLLNGDIRRLCQAHPLFMDVWQDIRFTPDRQRLAFVNPDRLFVFLLARAYEYQELLYNPAARFLDFHLTNLVRPLYENGSITKDQLLSWSNRELEYHLFQHHVREVVHLPVINAADYKWRRFDTETDLLKFKTTLGELFSHIEHISGFNPNLNWPVFAENGTDIIPIGEYLPKDKIDWITNIVDSTRGHYIYWHAPTP